MNYDKIEGCNLYMAVFIFYLALFYIYLGSTLILTNLNFKIIDNV